MSATISLQRFRGRVAVGLLLAAGAVAAPAAQADDGNAAIDALSKTTCSKQQVIDQIQKSNPVAFSFAAGQGDAMRLLNAVLDDFLNKSPEQRRVVLNNLRRDFPESYGALFDGDSQLGQSVQGALASCGES